MNKEEREALEEQLEHWIDEGTRHGDVGWGYVAEHTYAMLQDKKAGYKKHPLHTFLDQAKASLQMDVAEYIDSLKEQVDEILEEE